MRLQAPIQMAIASRSLAAARADEARAGQALKLTKDEVEHGIEEARAGLEAAKADLVLAEQQYTRFTGLYKVEAAPERRAQEVTQARDAARAHEKLPETKLATATADRTRVQVA